MEQIETKNFFLTIFGDSKNIENELRMISESDVRFVSNDTMFMCTFQSTLFAKDIEILLSDLNLKFVVCEMVPSLFSANLGNLNKKLFVEPNPKDSKIMYDYYQEIKEDDNSDLTLDELLDIVSKVGYDKLSDKQKEKLNKYSNNV